MFGSFGLPNLDEMTKMVADFQVRHERMVAATERLEKKLDLIIEHFGLSEIDKSNWISGMGGGSHDDSN